MKLLMLIYSGSRAPRISALLESHAAPGYTEFDDVHGMGESGRLAGDRVWPGKGTVFVSAVPDDGVAPLLEALRSYRNEAGPDEHLHVATLPVEDYF